MKKGHIIIRIFNWQMIYNGKYIETQMRDRSGKWGFVDCVYRCIHCGTCLGCHYKTIKEEDEFGNVYFNELAITCDKSPNGLHEYDMD